MKLEKAYTLNEIAALIQAKVIGDGTQKVTGINEIHKVENGDITFVDHPKYYVKALQSKATYVIINKEVAPPDGKGLLFSNDPFRDYVSLVKHFRPFVPCSKSISDTAEIGIGTIIQPGAFIGNNVKIGNDCIIHSNVSIYDNTQIGNGVIIHSSTVIGKGTKIDNHVQVGHDTVVGEHCLFASQVGIAGVVRIEDHVILWGQVGVQKDLTIGEGAVVLGQSGVGKTLEGNKIYFGSPVRDARDKMKEIALVKQLPELFEKLK